MNTNRQVVSGPGGGKNNSIRSSNRNEGYPQEQFKSNKYNGSNNYTEDPRRNGGGRNERNVRSGQNPRQAKLASGGNRSGVSRGHKQERNGDGKSEKVAIKLDDPRYTAKYWTSTGSGGGGSDNADKEKINGNTSKTVNLCC